MALRKVFSTKHAAVEVRVFRDAEWGEYRARLYIGGKLRPEADYHTDDRIDATTTALDMAARARATPEARALALNEHHYNYGAGFYCPKGRCFAARVSPADPSVLQVGDGTESWLDMHQDEPFWDHNGRPINF